MHAVWSRTTNERLAALGLDFLSGYVWGRAAALGEPSPGVVVSAFAVFEPGMVTAVYDQGRQACGRAELLAARTSATIESLSAVIGGDSVRPVADAVAGAVEGADGTGRPLFSGLRDEPWPDDDIGRLWHACELAREHRGDSHVAVCVEHGLGPVEMNILTELFVGIPLGAYTGSRGWAPDAITEAAQRLQARGLVDGEQLTDSGQTFRVDIETATDALEAPITDALGADAVATIDQLDRWSTRCIEAGAFPPDVFKRAAG